MPSKNKKKEIKKPKEKNISFKEFEKEILKGLNAAKQKTKNKSNSSTVSKSNKSSRVTEVRKKFIDNSVRSKKGANKAKGKSKPKSKSNPIKSDLLIRKGNKRLPGKKIEKEKKLAPLKKSKINQLTAKRSKITLIRNLIHDSLTDFKVKNKEELSKRKSNLRVSYHASDLFENYSIKRKKELLSRLESQLKGITFKREQIRLDLEHVTGKTLSAVLMNVVSGLNKKINAINNDITKLGGKVINKHFLKRNVINKIFDKTGYISIAVARNYDLDKLYGYIEYLKLKRFEGLNMKTDSLAVDMKINEYGANMDSEALAWIVFKPDLEDSFLVLENAEIKTLNKTEIALEDTKQFSSMKRFEFYKKSINKLN